MINEIIHSSINNSADFIVGFADLNRIVEDSSFRFGIVIGKRLDNQIIDSIIKGPTLEYFNHYKAVNAELSELIHKIANQIIEIGYRCRIVEPSVGKNITGTQNYKITLRTPVSHKMIGTRAGLGWIGKTDLFITKKFGPRLRLVSLLTDYPLVPSVLPINKSKCGKCNICVNYCPANAATGQLWDINTDRDMFFNAHKCRDKCIELTKTRLNLDATICGICVSACPIGNSKRKK
jgi:epoxyqueuosine reductase QueG